MLSEDQRALLRAVLRAQPATRADLEELADGCVARPAEAIEDLLALGFLRVHGTEVSTAPPAQILQDRLTRSVRDHQAQMTAATEEVLTTLRDLVGFVEDAGIAGRADENLRVEFMHGPMAPRDASMRLQQRRGPVPSLAVLPDAGRLEAPPPEFLAEFLAMMRLKPHPDRVLLGPHDASAPDLAAALDAFRRSGAAFRVRADLPSWFAVDDDDWVALPVTWGESWPSSVVQLQHAGIAGAMRHLFELLWAEAPAVDGEQASWQPVLDLMATGATPAQAADSLGISERTVRRRIDQALRHHRVRTLFELGVAVGRSRR